MTKPLNLFHSGILAVQIPCHCGQWLVNIPFKIWHPDKNVLFHMHIELRDDFSIYAFLMAQLVKNPPAVQEIWVRSLGWEDPLEKGKAIHSSVLA